MSHDPLPRLGLFLRIGCRLTGADPAILSRCPSRDHSSVTTIAYLMLGVWLWQTIAFALTAHMLLDEASRIRPELVAIAALMAGLVMLVDSFSLIRASWFTKGMEQLRRGGVQLPGYVAMKVRNSLQLLFRLPIAVILSVAGAIGFNLYCASPEIERELALMVIRENAPLLQRTTTAYDSGTARLETEMGTLRGALSKGREDSSTFRLDTVQVIPDDPELKAALDQERRAHAAFQEAERRLARTGLRDQEARLAALQRAGMRRSEWQAAQLRVTRLRNQAQAADARRREAVQTRLTETQAAGQQYQTRLDALEKVHAARIAAREASIRAAVERDPAYRAVDRGLLARVKVLAHLMTDPAVLAVTLVLHLAFLAIELGAVLCKVLTSIPSTYAVLLASEELAQEAGAAQALWRRLEGEDTLDVEPESAPEASSPAPAAETVPVPPPPANDDAQSEPVEASVDRLEQGAKLARAQAAARDRAKARTAKPPAEDSSLAASVLDGPVRRGRGRPPGTKNRAKPANDDHPGGDDSVVA